MRPDRRETMLGLGAALASAMLPAAARAVGSDKAGRVREFDLPQGSLTALHDGTIALSAGDFGGVPADTAEELLAEDAASVNAFLYRDGTRTVLIDAGGAGASPRSGGVAKALAELDVDPRQVDTILLTHLHADHISGLVSDGEAAFPFAEIRVHTSEVGHWNSPLNEKDASRWQRPSFEATRALFSAYDYKIRDFGAGEAETEVTPGFRAVPLPGHTPGHTGYLIGQGRDAVLVWGDVVHSAALQLTRPEAGYRDDVDPDLAVETRRAILERVVEEELRVAGMHLPFPGLGRLTVKDDGTYRWKPAA
ncbi:MAG: MBL fold metallo-hydrolase [Pseudomonadota bacterium]